MMQSLAPAIQKLLVTGFAGDMFDEFDLRVVRVRDSEAYFLFKRTPAQPFVSNLVAEVVEHLEARHPHRFVEEVLRGFQIAHYKRDLMQAAADISQRREVHRDSLPPSASRGGGVSSGRAVGPSKIAPG